MRTEEDRRDGGAVAQISIAMADELEAMAARLRDGRAHPTRWELKPEMRTRQHCYACPRERVPGNVTVDLECRSSSRIISLRIVEIAP